MNDEKDLSIGGLKEMAVYDEGAQEQALNVYNRTIGLMLLFGFAVNALLTHFLGWQIYDLMSGEAGASLPVIFLIGYLVLCFAGNAVMRGARSDAVCFLGYCMIVVPVGVLLSSVVCTYDRELVSCAMLLTGLVTACMMGLSMWKPEWFLSIGRTLGISLGVTILVEFVASFFFHYGSNIVDWAVVAIMSLYVGYDWARANTVQPTVRNAIIVSASLYLDIVNIFLRLLRILGKTKKRR